MVRRPEAAFLGHYATGLPAREGDPQELPDNLEFGPGGLAMIWADENSREALFESLQRRETYATSGTRLQVRFFAGWDLPQDLCSNPDMVRIAYAHGVPMGGEIA